MKAKLDGIYSPDLPSGYDELPESPKKCWVVVHADIGLDDGTDAQDCFTFYVCTPRFLEESLKMENFQIGRSLIVVSEFDWLVVENAIESICLNVKGDSWRKIAMQLSQYCEYEFESQI